MHLKRLEQERQHIATLFDNFARRFAHAVTGLHFESEQGWVFTGVGALQGRGEFLGVRGYDAIIGVRRHNERRGIRNAFFDVVKRRISVEKWELLRVVFRVPVLARPVATDGEAVIAQHVDHGNLTDDRAIKIRTLYETGRRQESAVTSAVDGEPLGARVGVRDEPFTRRDKIVEDVLLPVEHSRAMPLLAILAAAT